MPFSGFRCVVTEEPVAVADCLAHAVSEGGLLAELGCPFTPAILRGIAESLADQPMPNGRWGDVGALPQAAQDGRSIVRVTHLLACAQRTQYQRDHPYWMDPRDGYNLFRGQIGHAVIERHHGAEILLSEERLRAVLDGVTITGQPDAVVDTERRHLDDYKTTKRIPKEPYEHHVAQLNIYAWLLRRAKKLTIETASIVYLDMGGVARLPAPVWSLAETETYLRERLALWKAGTPTPAAYECKSCPLNGRWHDDNALHASVQRAEDVPSCADAKLK